MKQSQTQTISNQSRPLRVLISGGGTGGHIFPALSIANALMRRNADTEILFVGAEGRMEADRVPTAGYDIELLPVAGFDRKKLWRNVSVIMKLLRSMIKARRIVRRFRPDVAIGVGGYASGPTLKAAQQQSIPTLLQEQNSYAGVTNKLLARKAQSICVAYEGMERFFPADKITLTGNPVRKDLTNSSVTPEEARAQLGFDPSKPMLLVVGGSLGARTINQAIEAALPKLKAKGVQVLWQTGKLYADKCIEAARPYAPTVKAQPFITDMAAAYRAATLMVSRAGASTISEIQLLGIPAVLIPSPNVAEDHQRKNAEALARKSAAVMIPDTDAVATLPETLDELLASADLLQQLGQRAKSMALCQSDERIIDQIYRIAK